MSPAEEARTLLPTKQVPEFQAVGGGQRLARLAQSSALVLRAMSGISASNILRVNWWGPSPENPTALRKLEGGRRCPQAQVQRL